MRKFNRRRFGQLNTRLVWAQQQYAVATTSDWSFQSKCPFDVLDRQQTIIYVVRTYEYFVQSAFELNQVLYSVNGYRKCFEVFFCDCS